MDLRDLAPFVAVAEELHFSRAATRLNTAQPAVSRSIRRLEGDLGVQLLVRSSSRRRVQLTPAGKSFLGEVRVALSQVDKAARTARRVARGEVGSLRVGHVDSASSEILPGLLRAFRQRAPDVRIALEESTTENLTRALDDGEFDVVFVRPPVDSSTLMSEGVAQEPLVVALSNSHPLAAQHAVSVASLSAERFVLLPRHRNRVVYDRVIDVCRAGGFSPNIAEEAFPISSVMLLVSAGLGLSVVPAFLSKVLRQPDVSYVRFEDPSPTVGLDIVWRVNDTSPTVASFVELARENEVRVHP